MLAVLTPDEMAAVDAAAPEPVEVLIRRAAGAVAHHAVDLMGGTYGRRVVVIAGKGNNGNDGRVAAELLARRGVRTRVVPADAPGDVGLCDLVIDAAYGTGFRGTYEPPDVGSTPVLAVDIPSGVTGLTGEVGGEAAPAVRTVTFAALKPGLLFQPGRELAGEVVVADIGLDVTGGGRFTVDGVARTGLVTADDVATWVPRRAADAHKWKAALVVAAGSAGMTGAAHLAAAAAQRAGAGMVRVASPGVDRDPGLPTEAVGIAVPSAGWESAVADQIDRASALVIGPGLGLSAPAEAAIHHLVAGTTVPTLVDGDALTALGTSAPGVIGQRVDPGSVVLTPHDGEFARLSGAPPGADRCAAARDLAARTGAVVVLKGPTTVVAAPDGRVRLSTAGDQRLATAGTGDVLAGTIGALLARGADPLEAAASGAWIHGTAALEGPPEGLVASDLVAAIPTVIARLRGAPR
jgi:ADP-dependent NAD(P)H-hydrate dehydratase / NAD(P)H-hydrate epimerase